jgi:hypothetical protein
MNKSCFAYLGVCFLVTQLALGIAPVAAQTTPSVKQIEGYSGLHLAAHSGDRAALKRHIAEGADLEARDSNGRTPLHVAAFASRYDVVRILIESGADPNVLDDQAYDIVTIASVADDLKMVDLALKLGASAGSITSPYEGTALIAAAHLGHYKVVERLIAGGAPLNHVNNLGWTALMEAVVLGDGGQDHVKTVRALIEAGAGREIPDNNGVTPIGHARVRGYREIAAILEASN